MKFNEKNIKSEHKILNISIKINFKDLIVANETEISYANRFLQYF